MKPYKKTKIVATLGPASSDRETIKAMLTKGVDVCRLNFSHADHEEHLRVINLIREINEETGWNTSILADLQGPKIRIGEIEGGTVDLIDGEELVITTEECVGNAECVSITYDQFPNDINVGEKVLVDDGKLHLKVLSTDKQSRVVCKVVHGGPLSSRKGINLPNTRISLPSLTPKDREDLEFALTNQLDWLGLSFVRSARDIIELKHIIREHPQGKHAKVIAKIEKPEALEDIDEIIRESDGIMVARGDLGVEIPMQNVPLVQKMLVKKCTRAAKPTIIATQMMESMIEDITPTRAEVNDVANAVTDGADAVMLSGETSVGKHPVKVIEAMTSILAEAETFEGIYYHETVPTYNQTRFITDSICFNACRLAKRVAAKSIITMTHSGYTAFKLSSQRPKASVYIFTGNRKVMTQLSLLWGVRSFYYDKMVSTDHTIDDIMYLLKKNGAVVKDDLIINIASMPINEQGMSNMLKLSYVK